MEIITLYHVFRGLKVFCVTRIIFLLRIKLIFIELYRHVYFLTAREYPVMKHPHAIMLSFFEQFLKLASRALSIRQVGLPRNFVTNFRKVPSAAIANREGRLRVQASSLLGSPLMQSFPTARKLFPALFDTSWRTVTMCTMVSSCIFQVAK